MPGQDERASADEDVCGAALDGIVSEMSPRPTHHGKLLQTEVQVPAMSACVEKTAHFKMSGYLHFINTLQVLLPEKGSSSQTTSVRLRVRYRCRATYFHHLALAVL